ncbi:MAG: hypothetical protein ACREDR_42105 [Blastocatellia bacterium]
MNKWARLLDHPLLMYLVIGSFSLGAAYLLWELGSAAGLSGTRAGVSFQAGGSLAGFILVFYLSLSAFVRLHGLAPKDHGVERRVRVFLEPRKVFERGTDYNCRVVLYDDEIGEERTLDVAPKRENGYLTIDLADMRRSERFKIELRNSSDKVWESEYHHLSAPRAEMRPL